MSQSLVKNLVHLVYSTKRREPMIPADHRAALCAYQAGIFKQWERPRNQQFSWQAGYAAFSVSQSSVEAVQKYIERQEEHHRKISFQDELRALFKRHCIEFDERYVWD